MPKQFMKATGDIISKKVVVPFIDWLLSRIISRKFIVFLVATWLVHDEKISGTEWSVFAGVYVAGLLWLNHLEKMAEKRKQEYDFRGADNVKIFENDD